jgi:hypothetical protein
MYQITITELQPNPKYDRKLAVEGHILTAEFLETKRVDMPISKEQLAKVMKVLFQ